MERFSNVFKVTEVTKLGGELRWSNMAMLFPLLSLSKWLKKLPGDLWLSHNKDDQIVNCELCCHTHFSKDASVNLATAQSDPFNK